jgi:phosphate/sulfate permease
MKEFIKKNIFVIVFTVIGAISGFLYWKYVGCLSGTCPIKSVWYLSTLWGLAFGYLAGSIIKDTIVKIKNRNKDKEELSVTGK